MGNSCCHPDQSNSRTAKLIDSNGKLRRFNVPITAAELMLEDPGNFVASVEDLRRTRRVTAMRADDELLAGKLYMFVTAGRVNCVVSELEMAVVESACRRSSSRRGSSSKVLPAADQGPGSEKAGGGVGAGSNGEKDTGFSGHKLGKYRPWKPVLEPISEGY